MSEIDKKKNDLHLKVDETINKIIKQLATILEASKV